MCYTKGYSEPTKTFICSNIKIQSSVQKLVTLIWNKKNKLIHNCIL